MPQLLEPLESRTLFSGPFSIGDPVAMLANGVNVRAAAAGTVVGSQNSGQSGTVTSGPVVKALNGTTYTWYAVNWNTGADGWSADAFIGPVIPAAPVLVSPGAATSPGPTLTTLAPTLQWSAVAGATGYGVYVKDATTNTPVYNNSAVGNVTSVTIPALTPGHAYRWNAQASNGAGVGGFSSLLYFQTPTPVTTTTVYQAEAATISAGAIATKYAGYTGSGYVDFGGSGSYVQFSVARSAAGNVKLAFRYANGSTLNETLTFRINGSDIVRLPIAPTGSWTTWKTVTFTVPLKAGTNAIRLIAGGNGGPDLDSLTVSMGAPNLKFNHATFLAKYQSVYGSLNTSQTDGLNQILSFIEADGTITDIRWAAYMLATVKLECANRWQAIEEFGKGAGHPYGEIDPATGFAYYGRGYVQLTWAGNYQRLGAALGVDLYHNPSLALRSDIAYKIMSYGMKMGTFTGVGFAWYLNDTTTDYVNARRIINGTNAAATIAGYATKIAAMLTASKTA